MQIMWFVCSKRECSASEFAVVERQRNFHHFSVTLTLVDSVSLLSILLLLSLFSSPSDSRRDSYYTGNPIRSTTRSGDKACAEGHTTSKPKGQLSIFHWLPVISPYQWFKWPLDFMYYMK